MTSQLGYPTHLALVATTRSLPLLHSSSELVSFLQTAECGAKLSVSSKTGATQRALCQEGAVSPVKLCVIHHQWLC